MADPEVWRALIETGNPYVQQERQQKGLMGMMLLQEKQREMQDAQRLRDLYSSPSEPSMRDVMAISPEFGMKMQGERLKQIEQQLGMQKTQAEIEKIGTEEHAAKAKIFANVLGPIAEQFPANGNPAEWKAMIGTALANIEKMHGIKPDVNFEDFTPDQVLQASEGFGYPSMRMKQRMAESESFGSQYGKARAPSMQMTPEGYAVRVPGIGGTPVTGMSQRQMSSAQPSMTQEDVTEPQLQAYIASLPEGPDKQRLMSVISRGQSMEPGATSTVEVTPEELARIRKFNEAEKAKAVETAKLEAGKEQTVKQREEILSSIPDRSEIESLIDKSIGSGIEQQVKGRLGPMVGSSSEALSATKQLDVIAPQLKSITKSLAGAGAISDFEQKMMADAAGAIADPNVPPDARKAAFKTFMDIMDKANKSAKPMQSGLPKPKTAAEARALPKGTQFIDPNGIVRINE